MKQHLGAALGAAAVLGLASAAPAQLPAGTPAPAFTLKDTRGQPICLSQYRGKQYVLLNFWASWSPYCREEMPQLRSLQEKFGQRLIVLGVNAGERGETDASRAAVGITAARQAQLDFPVLLNGDPVMDEYEANGFPATFLIDPAGRIVAAQVGVNPDLWPRVEALVAAYQPPAEAAAAASPRKAAQILHELDFPAPPGPHEWVVGRNVVIRFHRPEGITADLVALSVDGKPVAVFGPDSAYTWDATTVSDGVHKLRVAAQTASGRETWAADQTVIVDNREPRAAAPSPSRGKAAAKARKVAKARKNPN